MARSFASLSAARLVVGTVASTTVAASAAESALVPINMRLPPFGRLVTERPPTPSLSSRSLSGADLQARPSRAQLCPGQQPLPFTFQEPFLFRPPCAVKLAPAKH